MATVEFLEEQTRAVSDFCTKLADWKTRRQSLRQAIKSLRGQVRRVEQNARAAIVQGQENEARELLVRKLVAEKRTAACENELQQVQAERDVLHADGCAVLKQAQAFNLSANVTKPDERQVRLRLREECRTLKYELDSLWSELEPDHTVNAWKARLEGKRQVVTSPAPEDGPGAPLGERNSRVIPQDVKIAVSARDGGRCRQCGSTQDLHFDHVIPWSKGGTNTVQNIQLLCGPCNRRKGADDIPATGLQASLFATKPQPPALTHGGVGLAQTGQPSTQKLTRSSADRIALTNFTVKDIGHDRHIVYGEATNNAGTACSVALRATFYDGNQRIIGSASGFVSDLGANETKVFTLHTHDDVAGYVSMKVQIDTIYDR